MEIGKTVNKGSLRRICQAKVLYHKEGGFLGQLLLGRDVVADVAKLLLHDPNRLKIWKKKFLTSSQIRIVTKKN